MNFHRYIYWKFTLVKEAFLFLPCMKKMGIECWWGKTPQLTKKYKHSAWWFSFKLDYRRKEKCGLNISFLCFSYLCRKLNSLSTAWVYIQIKTEFVLVCREHYLFGPSNVADFVRQKMFNFTNLKLGDSAVLLDFLLVFAVPSSDI